MKYILFLLVIALASCGYNRSKLDKSRASIIRVNKCQYVVYTVGYNNGVSMVHAADCNNSLHKYSYFGTGKRVH